MARPEPTQIEDDEVLTQFGEHLDGVDNFRKAPRPNEEALSMLRGSWERSDAGQQVRRRREPTRDAARYTTARGLRAMGFKVEHTPSRMNPSHVSISCPHGWTEDMKVVFDGCFDDLKDLPSDTDGVEGPEDEGGA